MRHRDLAVLFLHLIVTSSLPRLSRRRPVGCCRIRSRQTATPDPESFPETVTESAHNRIVVGLCAFRIRPAG